MKEGARFLEALNAFQAYHYDKPADTYIHDTLKHKRYIGGGDRRAIRALFYGFLRHHFFLENVLRFIKQQENLDPHSTDEAYVWMALAYGVLFYPESLNFWTGESHFPKALSKQQGIFLKAVHHHKASLLKHDFLHLSNMSDFWAGALKRQWSSEMLVQHLQALHEEAPLDLRVNTLRHTREQALKFLKDKGVACRETPFSPFGIRLENKALFDNQWAQEGLFEPQDEGSQLVTLLCQVKGKKKILDMCAGAGGKTLSLSLLMENQGNILATDVDERRLMRAQKRFRRLGLHNIRVNLVEKLPKNPIFDRVLVDAPCSGSGTWRRNPELKRRMGAKDVQELILKQRSILEKAKDQVIKGGRLIYSTCSLFHGENEDQVAWFLKMFPHFKQVDLRSVWQELKADDPTLSDAPKAAKESISGESVPSESVSAEGGVLVKNASDEHESNTKAFSFSLTPFEHGMDGFFVACFERTE